MATRTQTILQTPLLSLAVMTAQPMAQPIRLPRPLLTGLRMTPRILVHNRLTMAIRMLAVTAVAMAQHASTVGSK